MDSAASERAPIRPSRTGVTDFTFTDKDFRYIADLIGDHAGIVLEDIKKDLVYGRLVKRLRSLGLQKFSDYCAILERGDEAEFELFVNSLTTNLTGFYRESHHFDMLRESVLPALMKQKADRTLSVWSAGCSTGAEPYTIAMTLAEELPSNWQARVLGTDIDTGVLETARAGVYDLDWVVRGTGEARMKRWMLRGTGARAAQVRVKPEIRNMVSFGTLNLLESWPMRKPFDIIFCRNVVIYFDKPTQSVLFDRMASQMHPDGYLFIGHSESLNKICDRFKLIGKTVYQKSS
ncbi:protein-glutamate O-methyltransferase CheR [Mangrovimicrobium sediminis]|uniref:Chemotaxis protein methyltransferase n=1 Tax=Mangrovimicrobium sediminis TaxID=2562682 RepID=A0A4Z0LU83_9GAMM|nr:protein-glutamate O-methyltransferase CheR [Haliea sp. SAOS-164]